MSALIDPRIVRVGIAINGTTTWYEGLNIEVKGVKVANTVSGECDVTILNVKRDFREKILKETNPYLDPDTLISVIVEVGRESYGTTILFTGNVFRSRPTPMPDIGIHLRCIQGYTLKTKVISRTSVELSLLSTIAQMVADDNEVKLSFEVEDKNISSYSFTGSAKGSLAQLESLSNSNVFIDNGTLYVKNGDKAILSGAIRTLNKNTGLMSAEGTEYGCKVQMLFDPVTTVGGQIDLESEINPSLNGAYVVRKLPFHITSRGVPFYYSAECDRITK